jgi:hypothetical protein
LPTRCAPKAAEQNCAVPTRIQSIAALALGLLGGGCESFKAHTFIKIPRADVRDLGCLAVGISPRRDDRFPESSMLVELEVVNRCDVPTPFNVSALRMWSRNDDGQVSKVSWYDPNKSLGLVHVQIQAVGREFMRIDDVGDPGQVAEVCFDLSHVALSARTTETPICVGFLDEEAESH